VDYYWFQSKYKYSIKWFWNRLIQNKKFWKTKIESADIYDCSDPDTLNAGVLAKKKFGSKLIYDSHEYWKGTPRKETSLYYTLYSYIGNTIHYLRERFLIKNIDDMIVVSPNIQTIINKNYGIYPKLIMNLAKYNPLILNKKQKSFVFYGSKIRLGIDSLTNIVIKKGYDLVMIGNPIPNKLWINKGFMEPELAQQEMIKHKFGACIFNVNCDNIKYSLPNKLFCYIQNGIPILALAGMLDTAKVINTYKIGSIIDSLSEQDITKGINDLEKNYDLYCDNIQAIKEQFSWESQEKKLFEIYKGVE
jgi:hypothetical protein